MTSVDSTRGKPRLLCAGIVVLDEVFRVEHFPAPDTKAEATDYLTVGGGCAANAAVAIARLGGDVRFAGPLGGPAGEDDIGDRILANLAEENVDCSGCVRIAGVKSPVSGIFVNAKGHRTIVNHRDPRLLVVGPGNVQRLVADIDGVLADNRYPEFVRPICEAARARGLPVILDADRPTYIGDPLLGAATHLIFSSECLRATVGAGDPATALMRVGAGDKPFVAVTDGANDVIWSEQGAIWRTPVFKVDAVDTLAAGDVFHGAFALILLEGGNAFTALRFAAAAAAVKCLRFGGGGTSPSRAEVQAFLARHR